jgi:hypothetical protein
VSQDKGSKDKNRITLLIGSGLPIPNRPILSLPMLLALPILGLTIFPG